MRNGAHPPQPLQESDGRLGSCRESAYPSKKPTNQQVGPGPLEDGNSSAARFPNTKNWGEKGSSASGRKLPGQRAKPPTLLPDLRGSKGSGFRRLGGHSMPLPPSQL